MSFNRRVTQFGIAFIIAAFGLPGLGGTGSAQSQRAPVKRKFKRHLSTVRAATTPLLQTSTIVPAPAAATTPSFLGGPQTQRPATRMQTVAAGAFDLLASKARVGTVPEAPPPTVMRTAVTSFYSHRNPDYFYRHDLYDSESMARLNDPDAVFVLKAMARKLGAGSANAQTADDDRLLHNLNVQVPVLASKDRNAFARALVKIDLKNPYVQDLRRALTRLIRPYVPRYRSPHPSRDGLEEALAYASFNRLIGYEDIWDLDLLVRYERPIDPLPDLQKRLTALKQGFWSNGRLYIYDAAMQKEIESFLRTKEAAAASR